MDEQTREGETTFTAKGIPLSLRPAFQEYRLEELDPDQHAFTIIKRTMAHGDRDELRWLFGRYGAGSLRAWVTDTGRRTLPRRRLIFWFAYFDLGPLPQRPGAWPH